MLTNTPHTHTRTHKRKHTHTHTNARAHTHTHTHTHDQQQLQTKSNWARHLLLMVISLAQTLLSCAKFRPLRVIKNNIIFADIGLAVGRPHALLQRRHVSSVRVGLANGTIWTPSQNWGNLLSELHVPHRQCFAGISNAFSASFTSIWPSFPRFYCTPNKACLLCATPAGNYRVQSPGFPKIVYYSWDVSKAVAKSWQRKIPQPEGHMVPTALIFVCIVL